MFARPLIDGVDFALNGKELRGSVALDTLPRLGDILANPSGNIAFALRGFKVDDRLMLKVDLFGDCRLRCQRCLGEMVYPVTMAVTLHLVSSGRIEEVDTDDEIDCIDVSSEIDVLSLVEDELLLGIPYAPRHPEGECVTQANELKQSANPFAVLADINKKQ
ncbi:MAG: YceD family protein [Sideroxydans sp.]|jgi:uncharacterized protein